MIMSFKIQGITWVGNICQKVEAACLDVEQLVSKNTVNYVENQVHNAGDNIMKFYSDVVQDILPPLVNPVKDDIQEFAQKGNASVKNYFKSMIGIEENHMNSVIKQSPIEPHASDPGKDQETNEPISHDPVNERDDLVSNYSGLGSDYEMLFQKKDDFYINENLGVRLSGNEDAITELEPEVSELVSPHNKKQVEASFWSDIFDENNENEHDALIESSSPSSNHSVKFESSEKKETLLGEVFPNISDGVGLLTNTGVSIEPKCAFNASSPLSPTEVASLVETCEKSVSEMRLDSSCSSLLEESYSHSNLLENFSSRGDIPDGPIAHPSTAMPPSICCENTEASLVPSSSPVASTQLFDDKAARVHEAAVTSEPFDLFGVSSEVPSSDSGFHSGDIHDSNLETIDLRDEVKFRDSCFSEDGYVFHQTRKQSSYRDRIKYAISSRKRSAKEYKLLAVWYGDDDDLCFDPENKGETALPSSSSSIPFDTNSSTIDPGESDWELL